MSTYKDWLILYKWYYGNDEKLPDYLGEEHYHDNFKGNVTMLIRCRQKLNNEGGLTLEQDSKLIEAILELELKEAYSIIVGIIKLKQ